MPFQDLKKIFWIESYMGYNFHLLLQGKGGYATTLWTWLVFFSISAWFYLPGKWLLSRILNFLQDEKPLTLSEFELFTCRWFLGSWVFAMVSFLLGIAGLYKQSIAQAIVFSGLGICLFYFIRLCRYGFFRRILSNLEFNWISAWSLLLAIWVFSWSLLYIVPPFYLDTLMTDMALPSYYAAEGKFTPNPFHVYSYFAQNNQMLMVWPLLAHARQAAYLIVWAFFSALLIFIYGWLNRVASKTTAVCGISLLVSSLLGPWLGTYIKNDLQLGIFLILHWWAIMFVFKNYIDQKIYANRWMLLSGMFAGVACGYKFTAVPTIFLTYIGSFLFFLMNGTENLKNRLRSNLKLQTWFTIGLLSTWGVWLVRNFFISSGNPFYPFLNRWFSVPLIYPWHATWLKLYNDYNLTEMGWKGFVEYIGNLTMSWPQGSVSQAAIWWGPTAWLCFSAFMALSKRFAAEVRWIAAIGIISWIFSLFFALKPPYHAGPIIFVFIIIFGFVLGSVLEEKKLYGLNFILPAAIFLDFVRTWFFLTTKNNVVFALVFLLSGLPPGHFYRYDKGGTNFSTVDEMNWTYFLINKYSPKTGRVLFVGDGRPYGIERRYYANFSFDMQPIQYYAEHSKNAEDLAKHLFADGFRDVVLCPTAWSFYLKNTTLDGPPHNIPIRTEDREKIISFLNNFLALRFTTPSQKIFWLSIKSNPTETFPSIPTDAEDVYNFPLLYLDKIDRLIQQNDFKNAEILMNFLKSFPENPNIAPALSNLNSFFATKKSKPF